MDKLRALQYFVAAAEAHSFSGAARRLEVSIPAIAKLITSLERSLETRLFDRTAQGLTLTAGGEHYLEACQPALHPAGAATIPPALSGNPHRPARGRSDQ